MRELTVEQYLVRQVRKLGGGVRKVVWVGRRNAPDRLVMLPAQTVQVRTHLGGTREHCVRAEATIWVELKNPETILTFPANAHERAQAREHERMRALGQRVEVIGTYAQVDDLLR
jgi:hypothetical protein